MQILWLVSALLTATPDVPANLLGWSEGATFTFQPQTVFYDTTEAGAGDTGSGATIFMSNQQQACADVQHGNRLPGTKSLTIFMNSFKAGIHTISYAACSDPSPGWATALLSELDEHGNETFIQAQGPLDALFSPWYGMAGFVHLREAPQNDRWAGDLHAVFGNGAPSGAGSFVLGRFEARLCPGLHNG